MAGQSAVNSCVACFYERVSFTRDWDWLNHTCTGESYTLNQYQQHASKTAFYPDAGEGTPPAISYTILGLAGESGELANLWKKFFRDTEPNDPNRDLVGYKANLRKELGDVLWYCAQLARELDCDLGDIARANVEKLSGRAERGKLSGSGDDR